MRFFKKSPTVPPVALWVGMKVPATHLVFSEITLMLKGEGYLVIAIQVEVYNFPTLPLLMGVGWDCVFSCGVCLAGVGRLSKFSVLLDCPIFGSLAWGKRFFLGFFFFFWGGGLVLFVFPS